MNLHAATKGAIIKAASMALAAHRPSTDEQMRAREMSLWDFFRESWHVIEPSTPLVDGFYMQALCEHVEAALTGKLAKQNFMALVPPGSAKSRIASVITTPYLWLRRPGWQVICASGNPRVASRDSVYARAIIESSWYQNKFGVNWTLADDQNEKLRFANSRFGYRMALATGSRVTGDRADALIVDDPLDASAAYSKAERDSVHTWWDQGFANRVNDPKRAARVIIQQRLHSEDLPGYLLAREACEWDVLTIPMEWDEARRTVTSLGWTDPRSVDGEPMAPNRYPADVLVQEKLRLGSSGYAGQHLQLPTAAEGELFRRGCLVLLTPAEMPPTFSQVVISLDTAFSTKTTADQTAIIVLGQFPRGVVILDVVALRCAYPQLRAIAEQMAEKWKPSAVLIENKASGQSLVQSLQQETSLPVVPVKVDTDKISRAHVATPSWEARRVHALVGAPWLPEFEADVYAFPKGVHDDITDALVQGINYLLGSGHGAGLISWYQQQATEPHESVALPAPKLPHYQNYNLNIRQLGG